ncbi:MAG: rRNA maturation RNase YbeY, partial [Lachnospiraceae bacterium]|nr:rRNA maturation RNase YbeY [Lachnospiraceae bacterium]
MTALFECETEILWDFDYMKLYEQAAAVSLDEEGCPYEVTVSLLLTDDDAIRKINSENRGIDKATDVLSFPMIELSSPANFSDLKDDNMSFDPDTGELILGDIVLSKDRIEAQAKEYGHSLEREYTFLIVHSMLHLMGYDHMNDDDRKLMEERQKIIMARLAEDLPNLAV